MRNEEQASAGDEVSTHAPTTIPEESTPVSPRSPGFASQAELTAAPTSKPQAGRFIENISTDGSRASAEEAAEERVASSPLAAAPYEVPETEMKAVRTTKRVFRRNSKSQNKAAAMDKSAAASQPPAIAAAREQHDSPSTDSTVNKTSDQTSSSDATKSAKPDQRAAASPDAGDENHEDHDDESHPWLAALYPLSHFIGYRPLSHPHTPLDRRRRRSDPGFRRFHYMCGCVLSFGLPVSGETGEVARYRDPSTGRIRVVQMYTDQVEAKLVNAIHSFVAAWVVVALLSLVSRSPFHRAHDAPLIIAAFATEAVVTFFAYRTPLAQPKNILLGNTISAVVGVAMQKAFQGTSYSVTGVYGIDWAAAATAVSVAIFAMQMLGFTHPPGAAIAILAMTNPETHRLAWWLVPIVVIGSLIVIGWALLINNVGGRRYPENWFYMNAFAEPPIIGPEKLPFSNSPFDWPTPRRGRKRRRGTDEAHAEKGFYRVPDSGARLSSGFGARTQPRSSAPKRAVAAGDASYMLGGADRARQTTETAQVGESFAFGTGAIVKPIEAGAVQDGRTTRASEVTKVDSGDSATAPQTRPVAPVATAQPPSAQAKMPEATEVRSRMIESEAVVSRNNSRGSKRSRRSVVVHVNENRRHSTGSNHKIPPVPAVQWRS